MDLSEESSRLTPFRISPRSQSFLSTRKIISRQGSFKPQFYFYFYLFFSFQTKAKLRREELFTSCKTALKLWMETQTLTWASLTDRYNFQHSTTCSSDCRHVVCAVTSSYIGHRHFHYAPHFLDVWLWSAFKARMNIGLITKIGWRPCPGLKSCHAPNNQDLVRFLTLRKLIVRGEKKNVSITKPPTKN